MKNSKNNTKINNKEIKKDDKYLGLLNKYINNINNNIDYNNISLIKEPFPILVINNAIQKDIYDKLDIEYPSLKTILECNNINSNLKSNKENPIVLNHTSRYSVNSKTLNNDFYDFNNDFNDCFDNNLNKKLTSSWKSFINYHQSKDFKKDILDTFNKINLNKNLNKNLENKNIINDNLERDLDFTFNYNLPVCYNYEPKLYEIENDKIVSSWFLMKKDNDNSKGGNLEIFYETFNETFNDTFNDIFNDTFNDTLDNKKLTKIISIPYQKNCLVLLFNQNKNDNKNKNNKIKFGFSERQLTIHTQRYLIY